MPVPEGVTGDLLKYFWKSIIPSSIVRDNAGETLDRLRSDMAERGDTFAVDPIAVGRLRSMGSQVWRSTELLNGSEDFAGIHQGMISVLPWSRSDDAYFQAPAHRIMVQVKPRDQEGPPYNFVSFDIDELPGTVGELRQAAQDYVNSLPDESRVEWTGFLYAQRR